MQTVYLLFNPSVNRRFCGTVFQERFPINAIGQLYLVVVVVFVSEMLNNAVVYGGND